MADTHRKGQWVESDWGNGTAHGKVSESFIEKVVKQIDGSEITRNADEDNPAYLIEQDDGQRVLKSHSGLRTGT